MKKVFKLNIDKPVDEKFPVTQDGGEYGYHRSYGPHRGVDYAAWWWSEVWASEGGTIEYSGMMIGSEKKTNYGNVIVIDHTPGVGEGELHIYTLYAHLESRGAQIVAGKRVEKGDVIGTSGNTGTTYYYKGEKKGTSKNMWGGYHLHFEVIESRVGWNNGVRVNPSRYRKTLEYPLTEEEIRKIRKCIRFDTAIDFKRWSWHADVYLGSKKIGHVDKDNLRIEGSIGSKELEDLMKSPACLPSTVRGSAEPVHHEINIGGSR